MSSGVFCRSWTRRERVTAEDTAEASPEAIARVMGSGILSLVVRVKSLELCEEDLRCWTDLRLRGGNLGCVTRRLKMARTATAEYWLQPPSRELIRLCNHMIRIYHWIYYFQMKHHSSLIVGPVSKEIRLGILEKAVGFAKASQNRDGPSSSLLQPTLKKILRGFLNKDSLPRFNLSLVSHEHLLSCHYAFYSLPGQNPPEINYMLRAYTRLRELYKFICQFFYSVSFSWLRETWWRETEAALKLMRRKFAKARGGLAGLGHSSNQAKEIVFIWLVRLCFRTHLTLWNLHVFYQDPKGLHGLFVLFVLHFDLWQWAHAFSCAEHNSSLRFHFLGINCVQFFV